MANEQVIKRKRGRPKKVVEVPIEAPEPVSNLTKSKFLGYCSCGFMISKKDLKSKFIYECNRCGAHSRVKTLRKESSGVGKYTSKKDFLDATLNADYHDMPAMNDHSISPKDLKVRDI